MKGPIVKILLILFMLFSMSTGCVPKNAITEEFVDCLVQTSAGAMDKVDSELESIDQNLYKTEEKLLKLEQVIVPALEWIESQKVKLLDEFEYGSWRRRVTPEGLAEFKNDQYEVTALELSVHGIGTPDQEFHATLRFTDLATKTTSDWETVESELKCRKSTLEQRRQTKLEDGHLAASTLLSVIGHLEDWEVREINSATYSISGPGLGIAGELTAGKWIYYRGSKKITPADTQSVALQQVLSGEL